MAYLNPVFRKIRCPAPFAEKWRNRSF